MYHAHPQFRYGGGIWMVQRIRDDTANTFLSDLLKSRVLKKIHTNESTLTICCKREVGKASNVVEALCSSTIQTNNTK